MTLVQVNTIMLFQSTVVVVVYPLDKYITITDFGMVIGIVSL